MVKTINCLLAYYCLENLPSTLILINLLARCKSFLTKSNTLCMMLNKLKNIFMTAKIRTRPFLLVIWCSSQPRISCYQAFTNCNHSLWAPFEWYLQDLVLISWVFHKAWLLFTHGFIPVSSNQLGLNLLSQPALADDSYEVETILQINKRGTHAKVEWVGYDSSYNQWIRFSEL